ncbi:MAG: GntR family transcriptional regulator [Pseudomonadota bacterium]
MAGPLYKHVYEQIIERVVKGELGPGAMLPSEKDLGAELGVSQGTARKALSELERKGIVQRRQGLGTFVATTTPESALFHFFRLREKDGAQVVPHLLTESITRRPVRAAERDAFSDCGNKVYELHRVRSVDGAPVVAETIILPTSLFPGLEHRGPLPNTLYALFQRSYGIAVVRADERLQAVAASVEDAKTLKIARHTPLLEVAREAIDITDRVVELRSSRYLTTSLHYDISLR